MNTPRYITMALINAADRIETLAASGVKVSEADQKVVREVEEWIQMLRFNRTFGARLENAYGTA